MKITIVKERDSLAEAFAESIATVDSQVEIRKLAIVEELVQFMQREGINRSQLAKRMGVPPSRITKMLSGDSNLTIDTLVRAGHAVGADLVQTFVPSGHKVRWIHDRSGQKSDSPAPSRRQPRKKPSSAKRAKRSAAGKLSAMQAE